MLLDGQQDVDGGRGCADITPGCPGPTGGRQCSPKCVEGDFSIRVVRETGQVWVCLYTQTDTPDPISCFFCKIMIKLFPSDYKKYICSL